MAKLIFGLFGAGLMIAFLGSIIFKVREIPLMIVVVIGLILMFVDLWQARNEPDT